MVSGRYRHYISAAAEAEYTSVLSGRDFPCKSAVSALLYMITAELNRPFPQMCGGLSHIVLSADTSRVDGPLLAIYCLGREQT